VTFATQSGEKRTSVVIADIREFTVLSIEHLTMRQNHRNEWSFLGFQVVQFAMAFPDLRVRGA
jgi:hypothetical protein